MKGASFRDVVIRGKELSGALITALINVYIKDNASVDAVSRHLRDTCPLLYTSDDSVCSKVHTHTHARAVALLTSSTAVRTVLTGSPWFLPRPTSCCRAPGRSRTSRTRREP